MLLMLLLFAGMDFALLFLFVGRDTMLLIIYTDGAGGEGDG